MASEPIHWVTPGVYKPPQVTRLGEDGEIVVEKYPATAAPPADHPLAGKVVRRWELMMDHHGHVLRVCYSGGAADYQMDHPNYGAALKRRHRGLGWFKYGDCPLALIRAGQLDPNAVHAAMRGESPCAPGTYSAMRPCTHTLAEEKHRKERNRKREEVRAERFRGEAEKLQRAVLQQQAENSQVTADAMKTLMDVVKHLIGGGGQWPMSRPNMTEEEFQAELKKRVEAKQSGEAPPPEPATDEEELARLYMEADAVFEADPPEPASAELAPEPPPVAPTKAKKK